jgi:hypothetical protein
MAPISPARFTGPDSRKLFPGQQQHSSSRLGEEGRACSLVRAGMIEADRTKSGVLRDGVSDVVGGADGPYFAGSTRSKSAGTSGLAAACRPSEGVRLVPKLVGLARLAPALNSVFAVSGCTRLAADTQCARSGERLSSSFSSLSSSRSSFPPSLGSPIATAAQATI